MERSKAPLFLLLLLISASLNVRADDDCDSVINGLEKNCISAVLMQLPPSSKCCKYVRIVEPECVCPKITPDITKVLKLSTALRIANKCKRELPHNYQCGAYTLP